MKQGKQYNRVVIVGAGFAGLQAAQSLAHQAVEVILIDRYNYHSFIPLLYQVATAQLAPEPSTFSTHLTPVIVDAQIKSTCPSPFTSVVSTALTSMNEVVMICSVHVVPWLFTFSHNVK